MARSLLLAAVLAAASLSACSGRVDHWAPQAPQLLGQRPGDTVETIPAGLMGRRATVISVVRASNEGGRLGLCGAVVVASPKPVSSMLMSAIYDSASYLLVGGDGDQPVKISPRFMHRYYQQVDNGILDAKALDYSALQGDCVLTDVAWRPDYLSSNRLELRKTVRVRNGVTEWDARPGH